MRNLLFLLILIFSCTSLSPEIERDNEIFKIHDAFIADARLYLNEDFSEERIIYRWDFTHLKINKLQTIGLCTRYWFKPTTINFNYEYWHWYNNSKRHKLLQYHELGHGLLDRNHLDITYKNIPLSIMNATLIPLEFFEKYEKEYIIELFLLNQQPLIDKIQKDYQ